MTPAGGPTRVADGTANGHAGDAPTQQLSIAAVSDRCVNCGSPLASDQRYCVNCGERRGKPRFTLAGPTEPGPDMVVTKTTQSRRPRTTAGFNLIAGIATLLLAMGVGVLIGHNSSSSAPQKSAASPTVITVGGGSGSAGTATTGNSGSSGGNSSGSKKSKSSKSSAKAAKAPAKVVVQKAAAAAAKVTGGNANVAGATATQGSSCSNGQAGCQNGKFTGNNFFGQ